MDASRLAVLLLVTAMMPMLIAAPAWSDDDAPEGPPEPEWATTDAGSPPILIAEDLAWNIEMQGWGHGLLGGGVALIITGTILIEADGQGGVGKAGFSTIGSGLGVMTIGMFLLGFSRPVHLEEPVARWSTTAVADGRGALLTYDRFF